MHITDIQNNSEPLTDFSGTEITRKLNGDYTLSFSILPTEQNKEAYNMIDKDNDALITCNNENFVVRALQVTRFGKTVTAVHEFFEIIDDFVNEVLLDGIYDIQFVLTHAFSRTPDWTFTVFDVFEQQFVKALGADNPIALLQTILETYGAEYTVSSVDRTVRIYKRLGIDTDYAVQYGHNLINLQVSTDASDVKTAIKVLYNQSETGEFLNSVVYTSPNANKYRRIKWEKTIEVDVATEAEALAHAQNILNDKESVAIAADFVHLQELGYEADDIDLGNSFWLIDEQMAQFDRARVVEIKTYPFDNTPPKVVCANRIKDMSDRAVKQQQQHNDLDKSAVHQKKFYNGVTISPEDGVKVASNNGVVLWLNATEGILIENNSVRKFYVDIDGNVIFDGKLQITNGDGETIMLEAFLDDMGGRLIINDKEGNLNVKLGSEERDSGQRGGILRLYDDGDGNLRVALGMSEYFGGGGGLRLIDNNDVTRIVMQTVGDNGSLGGMLIINDDNGQMSTVLTSTSGRIADKVIATEPWVTDKLAELSGSIPSGNFVESGYGKLVLTYDSASSSIKVTNDTGYPLGEITLA